MKVRVSFAVFFLVIWGIGLFFQAPAAVHVLPVVSVGFLVSALRKRQSSLAIDAVTVRVPTSSDTNDDSTGSYSPRLGRLHDHDMGNDRGPYYSGSGSGGYYHKFPRP